MAESEVPVRRIYDQAESGDGVRVLVDRVWPRGLRKADAHLDEWARDVAPSTELRRWYGHDPAKFAEFRARYHRELDAPAARDALAHLRELVKSHHLTLLTATRDVEHSHAVVLADILATPV